MTTSMNVRTHFFIKICLSHFIRKGWCWLGERSELETETDCYILTQISSRNHCSTSSSSWLGSSTVGRWGPKPSVWSWFSLRGHPISSCNWNWTGADSNWPKPSVAPDYIIVWRTCFLLAYAPAPNSTMTTGQGDIPISSTGSTCFAVLRLIYFGASLDWRPGRGSICYNISSKWFVNTFLDTHN